MDKVLQSLALLLPLIFVLPQCANLGCPPDQELGANACVCSSTLEPPVNGMCTQDVCGPDGCPCTLEGIEAAIARGGTQLIQCGDGAPPVDTTDTIVIDNDVTLNGQGNLIVQGNNRHRIIDVQPFEVELIGITISRGDQGIRVAPSATLTLTSSVVKENTAGDSAGGGILNDGVLSLVNTTVESNTATTGAGGGIYNSPTGMLTLTNSRVSNNVSEIGPGGGIRNNRGSLLVNESEVSENNAIAANGGGISNQDGTVFVTDSIIRGNTTRRYGGGISTEGSSAMFDVTGSAVSDNRSTGSQHAGGVWCNEGELRSTRSTWSGNTTNNDGGGLLIEGEGGLLTLTSSTVSGNSAGGVGGAFRLYNNALVRIINSTIYGNDSGIDGGALHMQLNSTAEIKSSTLSNNGPAGISNIDGTLTFIQTIINDTCVRNATTISMGHNIESPGTTCDLGGTGDAQGVPPGELNLADQLADNGGDTLTLMLTFPSAAVDNMISTCDQPEDQRGVFRPQGSECDVGAVEIE